MKNNTEKRLNGKKISDKVKQVINSYEKSADQLGSYTGVTEAMNTMPCPKLEAQANALAQARIDGGKVFCRLEDLPVQDVDDL